MEYKTGGDPFGGHRVIEPEGTLPQPAEKLNNSVDTLWDNEILIEVEALNIDSASFTQIKQSVNGDEEKIKEAILKIVQTRGKMHNPVTGSGGMLIGKVEAIGKAIEGSVDIKTGDKIATLISLSLTPLKIDEIVEIKAEIDQVRIKGKAILFESGLYTKLPDDIPAPLALAALDVAGAPAQTAKLVKPGDTVLILGAMGKSGVLCAYEAKKQAGKTGQIIGADYSDDTVKKAEKLEVCDKIIKLDATAPVECYKAIKALTDGKMADVVINCVNINNTELASILACRDGGTVYFFNMATSFTRAALGAEGVGKDVKMIIGNGYTKHHAELTLNILRESEPIRVLYENVYV